MRNVVFRYPSLKRMRKALAVAHQDGELALRRDEPVVEGEWVLATFEIETDRRATAAAGRASTAGGQPALVFEVRDWDRLVGFCDDVVPSGDGKTQKQDSAPPTSRHFPADEWPTDPGPPAASFRARVLCVEDDPETRELISVMLESVGLDVQVSPSGENALETLQDRQFDMVVLDWSLPGMSGLDVCRALRHEPRTAALPVLFLTANTSSQDMVKALACGADDYVMKPFRAAELGARIFALLRRARWPVVLTL